MKKTTAKNLRGIVNKGLDLTLKDIETMKPDAYQLMLEATKELITRNIKASDKEEYKMFLDTLEEYAPAGTPAPEAPKEIKKVANTKAPKKPAPAPEAPEETTPAPETKAKEETKEETKAPAKTKEEPEKPKQAKAKEKKPADKIQVGSIVKFQVEEEEIEHDIKIINIGKYNIIAVMLEDEKEVFNIRKTDFNKQVFAWKDRHDEKYNIIITI